MQHARGGRGHSPEHSEDAARFAALVRCSLEEAQHWLRRSAGTMEAALDSYLSRQGASKRHKVCIDSHVPYKAPLRTSAIPESTAPSAASRTVGLPTREANYAERGTDSSANARENKAASCSEISAATSTALVIDLADDSDDECANVCAETGVPDPCRSAGEALFPMRLL